MSRKPPSARDPQFAVQRTTAAVQSHALGLGRVRNAAPVKRAVPNRVVAGGGGDSTHPGSGTDSLQIGPGADGSGDSSVALGDGAIASGDFSFAVLGEASGDSAIALGGLATGSPAVAIGASAEAGVQSIALGYFANAGDYNIAIGQNAGPDSGDAAYTGGGVVNIGSTARSRGHTAVAIGYSADTFGEESVALGPFSQATGVRSVAIGKNCTAFDDDTAKIKADSLEVEPRSTTESWVILADSTGVRWKIGVDTSGNPIGLGAA